MLRGEFELFVGNGKPLGLAWPDREMKDGRPKVEGAFSGVMAEG